MARLYAATGDAIARLDEREGVWKTLISLTGSGAQCLALDPSDPDVVVRRPARGRRSANDRRRRVLDRLRASRAGRLLARRQRSRRRGLRRYRAECALSGATTAARPGWSSRACSSFRPARRGASRLGPGRRTCAGSRRARTTPTFCSSGSSSAGSCARPIAARPGTTTVRARNGTSTRSRGIHTPPRRAYEAGGGGAAWSEDGGDSWHAADEGRDRNYAWSVAVDPDDPELWYVSASTGPYAAHGPRPAGADVRTH